MKFTTRHMADVSTGHITESDGKLIAQSEAPYRIAELDPVDLDTTEGPGTIFTVPDSHDVTPATLSQELQAFGFSQAFIDIMLTLQKEGVAEYVVFDRDGSEVEGAPSFEW